MDFFSVLTLIGGLALFLYGMNVMGDGLSKISGGRLEQILEKLTNNPLKAVLVGAGVTAVIQSSSATTVMVVGFVNSGIMKLGQTVGIIMGANVGTTITSWILSLAGIESNNFFIRLLKPSSFSPVMAAIGVIFLMFSKKDKLKNIGMILVGFAVLMTGMDTMSGAMKPLANVPEFTGILTMFSNPILGMIAGMLLTAVIQSSSASVGILQALCATGTIGYATALPIIMGQNIGTCVTAMLSSVGANKNAKRAALVHLYFNIIGTLVFMVVFYAIHKVVNFAFMDTSASAAGIAVVHSVFNILATVLLLPFSKGLVKLAYLTIPEQQTELAALTAEGQGLNKLDARFLEQPGFAIAQCKRAAVTMAKLAQKSIHMSIDLLQSYDEDRARQVVELESEVDRYEDELGKYLLKLSSRNLSEKESHTLSVLLHSIGDFERISDHALNIKEAADEMHDKKMRFSDKATEEVNVFSSAIKDILALSIQVFETDDMALAVMVEPLEEVIDQLNIEVKRRHVKRLRKGKCTIELGFVLSDITTNFERVADHCSNIAVCQMQVSDENFEAHEYLDALKKEENIDFQGKVMAYKEKYCLP